MLEKNNSLSCPVVKKDTGRGTVRADSACNFCA